MIQSDLVIGKTYYICDKDKTPQIFPGVLVGFAQDIKIGHKFRIAAGPLREGYLHVIGRRVLREWDDSSQVELGVLERLHEAESAQHEKVVLDAVRVSRNKNMMESAEQLVAMIGAVFDVEAEYDIRPVYDAEHNYHNYDNFSIEIGINNAEKMVTVMEEIFHARIRERLEYK